MKVQFLDSTGDPLVAVSVNGYLRLYTNPNRQLYTGTVQIEASCENGADPCNTISENCDSTNAMPHFKQFPGEALQVYKEYGEYNHQAIKEAFNFEDTLPGGECSGQKLNIFLPDGIIYCVWHLEDGWNIDAIVEVPFCQPY